MTRLNLIIILAIVPVLVWCFSSSPKIDSMSFSGRVEKIGISTWMYGTHVLKDKNGKILCALESTKVILKDYENKNVEIIGNKVPGYPLQGGPILLDVYTVMLL